LHGIAQRPEGAIAIGSPEGGGRRIELATRPISSRHYVCDAEGRKQRPPGRFFISAAPNGASFFPAADMMAISFGFQNQPPLSRRRAPSTTASDKLPANLPQPRLVHEFDQPDMEPEHLSAEQVQQLFV
jgi:hypothetical protein